MRNLHSSQQMKACCWSSIRMSCAFQRGIFSLLCVDPPSFPPQNLCGRLSAPSQSSGTSGCRRNHLCCLAACGDVGWACPPGDTCPNERRRQTLINMSLWDGPTFTSRTSSGQTRTFRSDHRVCQVLGLDLYLPEVALAQPLLLGTRGGSCPGGEVPEKRLEPSEGCSC